MNRQELSLLKKFAVNSVKVHPRKNVDRLLAKDIIEQSLMAKAALFQLIVQFLCILTCFYVSDSIETRRYITLNSSISFKIAILYICPILLLISHRKRYGKISNKSGYILLEPYVIGALYFTALQTTFLGQKTVFITTCYLLSDSFANYFYLQFMPYCYPSGILGFSLFPKIIMTICFYVLHGDQKIFLAFTVFWTSFGNYISGVVFEEFIIDASKEFGWFDFFVTAYFDLSYIVPCLWNKVFNTQPKPNWYPEENNE